MYVHPDINPVFINFIGIKIYWYGLFYSISTIILYKLIIRRHKTILKKIRFNSLFIYIIIGIIFGGKLGVILYDNQKDIILILKFWTPGRSFYSGFLTVSFIIYIHSIYYKYNIFYATDIITKYIPIGITLCRIGNFINSELYGTITKSYIGIIFSEGGPNPRHPTQLYEAFIEGILIYIILSFFKKTKKGINTSIFLILYGLFRFFIELFKNQYYLLNIPIDKTLSVIMFLSGIIILTRTKLITFMKNIYT